jgi:hypothetical protein
MTQTKNLVSVFEESCDEKIVISLPGEKSSYFSYHLSNLINSVP